MRDIWSDTSLLQVDCPNVASLCRTNSFAKDLQVTNMCSTRTLGVQRIALSENASFLPREQALRVVPIGGEHGYVT